VDLGGLVRKKAVVVRGDRRVLRNIRERLVSALAGVFGLPLDERALWPDMILGACLAFSLDSSGAVLARYTMTQNIDEPLAMQLLARAQVTAANNGQRTTEANREASLLLALRLRLLGNATKVGLKICK
jgi:hypothetical protein